LAVTIEISQHEGRRTASYRHGRIGVWRKRGLAVAHQDGDGTVAGVGDGQIVVAILIKVESRDGGRARAHRKRGTCSLREGAAAIIQKNRDFAAVEIPHRWHVVRLRDGAKSV